MTNYLDQIFLSADIDKIISSQAEESINLEFKNSLALKNDDKGKNEIAKDVSAFANSDGGIIIYGISEKDHKADSLSFVDGNKFSKEWLEQVINSRIHRKINGLKIDPVRYNNDIDKSIYVVKIPISTDAPHISSDKKFYRRYNFESVPMEEYEIRNLYSRQVKTSLEIVDPKVIGSVNSTMSGKISSYRVKIDYRIKNIGKTIEKLYKLEIHIPLGTLSEDRNDLLKSCISRDENGCHIFSVPGQNPIFQNELATIVSANLRINFSNYSVVENHLFKIKLYFSSGEIEKSFSINSALHYQDKPLTIDSFKKIL